MDVRGGGARSPRGLWGGRLPRRCPRAPREGSSPAPSTATHSFLWLRHEPNNRQQKGTQTRPSRTELTGARVHGGKRPSGGQEERPRDRAICRQNDAPGPPPGTQSTRLPGLPERSGRNSLEHRGHCPSQLGNHRGIGQAGPDPLGRQAAEGAFPRALERAPVGSVLASRCSICRSMCHVSEFGAERPQGPADKIQSLGSVAAITGGGRGGVPGLGWGRASRVQAEHVRNPRQTRTSLSWEMG